MCDRYPNRIDIDRVHRFLSRQYWATGIPIDVVRRSIVNSLVFGLYAPTGDQVGFAGVVSDLATFAYLGDVYVKDGRRDLGLGKFLLECFLSHPDLQGLRKWTLATADARGLYTRYGFGPSKHPEMQLFIERAPADLWPAR